jgi:predicted PurR-regulated permease PerM
MDDSPSSPPAEPPEEESPLRAEIEQREEPRVRWRVDARSVLYVAVAVLAALAFLATARGTSTMLTRIAIGVLIALALDPIVDRIEKRLGARRRRGIAVTIVGIAIILVAVLVVVVLGPRAVDEIRQFSEQFPQTVGELERLPLVGDWIAEQDLRTRAERWVADLPEQFTDDRLAETARTLVSGVAAVSIVAVVAIAVLIDGENLTRRFRRLLQPSKREAADEVGRVVYDTLGRYVGGSLTVALMMGIYVLTIGLLLGVPLTPLAAIWAMLTDLIPQVGGALGGSFFVLLAVTESVPVAIAAAALFVVYMNIENHVIQPAIVGRSVDLSPPTTMVAAFVGGAVAGIPGALVATPLTGAAKQIFLEARGRVGPATRQAGRVGVGTRLRSAMRRLLRRDVVD